MKKVITTLISILVLTYIILAMVSSNDEYAAERLFYQAKKINRKILVNPDVAPPKMLASVENKLQRILTRYPKSRTAKKAHLSLAEFYLNNKKFDQAIASFDQLVKTYSEDKILVSRVCFLKGSSYERRGQWDKALAEYKILQDGYPDTPLGLSAPLYIANYYKRKGEDAQAEAAFKQAALFYKRIEEKNREKVLGYSAANLLYQTYINLQDYAQAGEAVEGMVDNYLQLLSSAYQLPNIEYIFIKKLNTPEKAKGIYRKIKAATNNPRLIELIDKRLKVLEAKE
jgi:tetratricopeptide (TPR) repeat protein